MPSRLCYMCQTFSSKHRIFVLYNICYGRKRTLVTQAAGHQVMKSTIAKDENSLLVDKIPWQQKASLYIHWPYCKKRCTYCNFNKYINTNIDQERMKRNLVKETQTLLDISSVKYVTSIFFGGGTPSLAEPSTIAAIIETVNKYSIISKPLEITLEANPTNLETKKLRDFKAAGINRLSLGIQALNNNDLKTLGRDHTVEDSLKCIEEAKILYPGCTSLDLIFGRHGQTVEEWKQELQQIVSLSDDHISLYQLTLERGTALFKLLSKGDLSIPDDDTMADMYEMAVETLKAAGFTRYEVSNFAKNVGAESVHNKNYWNGGQYIGVGPGAHGRFCRKNVNKREARIQTLEPEPWMREVENYGHATRKCTTQTKIDILEELLMVGLRTRHGIQDVRWRQFSEDVSLLKVFGDSLALEEFINNGLMKFDDKILRCSGKGISVVNSIVASLLQDLHNYQDLPSR